MKIFDFSTTDPYFTTTEELDGVQYALRFHYDFRADRWTLDMLDELDDPIVTGIRLIPGPNLLEQFSDPRLPVGSLEVSTVNEDRAPPELDDLGVDAVLIYLDASDVEAYDFLFSLADVPIEGLTA